MKTELFTYLEVTPTGFLLQEFSLLMNASGKTRPTLKGKDCFQTPRTVALPLSALTGLPFLNKHSDPILAYVMQKLEVVFLQLPPWSIILMIDVISVQFNSCWEDNSQSKLENGYNKYWQKTFYIISPTRIGVTFNTTSFQKWGIHSKLISSHMV